MMMMMMKQIELAWECIDISWIGAYASLLT